MKHLLNALSKGALALFALFTVVFIIVYALFTVLTTEKESVSALACTAYLEIAHQDSCGDIFIPEGCIEIASEQSLRNAIIEQLSASIIVNERWSAIEVLGIPPDQLAATTSIQYHEQNLGDSSQDQLIRYSSQEEERSWQTHYNSIVGPANSSIHPSGIEHLSLWTAAPISTLLKKQSAFSINSNRL